MNKNAIRKLSYGVYIISTVDKGRPTGCTANSAMQRSIADTEMEFLTGNSMAFMPFHSIPYNDKFPVKSPSIATTLKNQDYEIGRASCRERV